MAVVERASVVCFGRGAKGSGRGPWWQYIRSESRCSYAGCQAENEYGPVQGVANHNRREGRAKKTVEARTGPPAQKTVEVSSLARGPETGYWFSKEHLT